jgi:hypothetical protein
VYKQANEYEYIKYMCGNDGMPRCMLSTVACTTLQRKDHKQQKEGAEDRGDSHLFATFGKKG